MLTGHDTIATGQVLGYLILPLGHLDTPMSPTHPHRPVGEPQGLFFILNENQVVAALDPQRERQKNIFR